VDPLDARLAQIRLVVLDVDGTLTDGAIWYGDGPEMQRFDVRDGYALARLKGAGIRHVWITGRGCAATERRAFELGVASLVQHVGSKREALEKVQGRMGFTPEQTLAMGDDLPDLGLFERAGVCACPADAAQEVRAKSDLVSARPGGHGAVREVLERLLRAQSSWPGDGARP